MERITVTIPAQEFSSAKYTDHNNCYLAEALRKVLPERDISVSAFGYTYIDLVPYSTQEEFDHMVLRKAFFRGQDIKVTLIKLNL